MSQIEEMPKEDLGDMVLKWISSFDEWMRCQHQIQALTWRPVVETSWTTVQQKMSNEPLLGFKQSKIAAYNRRHRGSLCCTVIKTDSEQLWRKVCKWVQNIWYSGQTPSNSNWSRRSSCMVPQDWCTHILPATNPSFYPFTFFLLGTASVETSLDSPSSQTCCTYPAYQFSPSFNNSNPEENHGEDCG